MNELKTLDGIGLQSESNTYAERDTIIKAEAGDHGPAKAKKLAFGNKWRKKDFFDCCSELAARRTKRFIDNMLINRMIKGLEK